MKHRKAGALPIAVACLLAGLTALPDNAAADAADGWAWQHRPLIVVAPDEGSEKLLEQRRQLAGLESELRDRDMAVVEIVDRRLTVVTGPRTRPDGRALIAELGMSGNRFEVVLLGKDTGVKLRSGTPVSATDLFALIDAMPMRQREMAQEQ